MAEHFTASCWLEYLDGGNRDGAMKRHIGECQECASLAASLVSIRTRITRDADLIRQSSARAADLEFMLARCLAEIRTAPGAWSPAQATLLLGILLEPICGRGMARATIGLARRRSAMDAALSFGAWGLFISNLSETMSSVCGSAAGELVRRAGFSIALEQTPELA